MAYECTITNLTLNRERISRLLISLNGSCNLSLYNTTGVEITDITKEFKDTPSVICEGVSSNGYVIKWDETEKCFKAYYADAETVNHTHDFNAWEIEDTEHEIYITDDDDAASNGVQLYLRTNDGHNAWFEFVSPTNANGTLLLSDAEDADALFIKDNDAAATGTYPVYFDEDLDSDGDPNHSNTMWRLQVSTEYNALSQTIWVPTLGGLLIPIHPTANASVDGVPVYFDEDQPTQYAKLLFVSPTDTAGIAYTAEYFRAEWDLFWTLESTEGGGGDASEAVEVADDVDVGTFDFIAYGRRK